MKKVQAGALILVLVVLLALADGCGASKPVVKSVAPNKGFPGTGFKITGTAFGKSQGKSTVHLGPKVVTPSSWSDTAIAASVPRDTTAGDYGVTVTTGAGTGNKVSFTVSANFAASTPLPAMQNYFKTNGEDPSKMTFKVLSTSKADPNWKLDEAAGGTQGTTYFLFHKEDAGWAIVDFGTSLTADQLKADGAPSDIPPTQSASPTPSSATTK